MNIPKEELDKLNDTEIGDSFAEHTEDDEPMIPDKPVAKVEEKVSVSPDEDAVAEEKARVPYSRFETVNERAIRAEERLSILEEQLNSSKNTEENQDEIPAEFIELYGDSDIAKRAWEVQKGLNQKLLDEATEKAYERIERKQTEKQEQINKGIEIIEDNLEKFKSTLNRDLSEKEEADLLDIQDEFTPKDEDGNYIAPLLSLEKAYEVYTLRKTNVKVASSEARKKVVSLTGAETEGESSNSSFENYRPGVSGLWRNKL